MAGAKRNRSKDLAYQVDTTYLLQFCPSTAIGRSVPVAKGSVRPEAVIDDLVAYPVYIKLRAG